MKEIPDGVIDMILTDPPYGTTACKWDSIIPLEPMWEQLKRIIKQNGAIVMTASQPFTTALIASNMKMFRYCWVWEKTLGTNPMLVKKQPFRKHEDITVFYKKQPTYKPQMTSGAAYKDKQRESGLDAINGGVRGIKKEINNTGTRYPSSVQKFSNGNNGNCHPTQKPVALMEYLIKTYTNEGEIVLDFTAGSGTTAIAAENCGRKWVCIEQNEEYANKAVERILNHVPEVKPDSAIQIEDDIPIPEGEENGN
jgi:site-specific DNA-methyltransferase (adenine-specific)